MKNCKAGSLIIFIGLLVTLVTGCDPNKKWAKQEQEQIQAYLKSAGDTVYVKKTSGLYFYEILAGTGAVPNDKDTVSIKYKGMTLSGEVFGSNLDNSGALLSWIAGDKVIVGGASGMILDGLDEGVRYMKQGGKAKLLLPSILAYGAYGYYGVIPGYSPLLFYVELVEVKPAK